MNNNYQNPNYVPSQGNAQPFVNRPPTMNMINNETEVAFLYNILNRNVGKTITLHMSFPDSIEWRDKIFRGSIVYATREYIIIKSHETNFFEIVPILYLDYAYFEEEITI